MLRRLIGGLGALVLGGVLCGPALAQVPKQPGQTVPEQQSVPAPQYALAFAATVVILLILCMPSRKSN